jgi:hypothetical protein
MLVLSECHRFVFRGSAMAFAAFKTFALTLVFWTVLGFLFLLWTMPFLLGFAAVHRSSRGDLWAMKTFRRPSALIPIGMLAVAGALYLRTVPVFDGPWEQEVTITQKLDAANKTVVEFSSFGYLRGIRATIDGREQTLHERKAFKRIEMPFEMNWLKEQVTSESEEKGPDTLIHVKLRLDFEKPPFAVSLRLKSGRPFRVEAANVKYRHTKNRALIRWAHDPGPSLSPEMDIQLPKGAGLEAEVTATFLEGPVRVAGEGKKVYFIQRAEIKRRVQVLGRTRTFS